MPNNSYKIKELFSEKAPREKLIEDGLDSLSNAELLAMIFVTGTRYENVIELSNRIFKEYGSRSITGIKDIHKAIELLGIGTAKACQLISVFELGRRFYLEESLRMPTIRDPEDVFELHKSMSSLKKEELRALYLNSRQRVIHEELISLGNENTNIVSPKEILHPAVEILARGIILVHNHPSGSIEPSIEDIEFTKKMKSACDLLGVNLLDHIIIGANNFFSFKVEKYIEI